MIRSCPESNEFLSQNGPFPQFLRWPAQSLVRRTSCTSPRDCLSALNLRKMTHFEIRNPPVPVSNFETGTKEPHSKEDFSSLGLSAGMDNGRRILSVESVRSWCSGQPSGPGSDVPASGFSSVSPACHREGSAPL